MLESTGDLDPDSITADKLRQILESVNALEPIRNPDESSLQTQARRIEDHWNDDHAQVLEVINATEQSCTHTYNRI